MIGQKLTRTISNKSNYSFIHNDDVYKGDVTNLLTDVKSDLIHFERNMEIDKERNVPAIAKINLLMNQISTNLANTLYDNPQNRDQGIFY